MKDSEKVFCVDCEHFGGGGIICNCESTGYKMNYITRTKQKIINPKFRNCQKNENGECGYFRRYATKE